MKGTIFTEHIFGKISRPRLISIRWNFVWGKGTRFQEFLGGPILKIEIFNAFLFICLIGRGARAPITRECISFFLKLNSRSPNHSFNLAPSISYSGGGGGPNYSDPRIKASLSPY